MDFPNISPSDVARESDTTYAFRWSNLLLRRAWFIRDLASLLTCSRPTSQKILQSAGMVLFASEVAATAVSVVLYCRGPHVGVPTFAVVAGDHACSRYPPCSHSEASGRASGVPPAQLVPLRALRTQLPLLRPTGVVPLLSRRGISPRPSNALWETSDQVQR